MSLKGSRIPLEIKKKIENIVLKILYDEKSVKSLKLIDGKSFRTSYKKKNYYF